MTRTTGINTPAWAEGAAQHSSFVSLQGDRWVDVCVIGPGMAGLSTAYMLAREGKSVIVLGENGIRTGEIGPETAYLSCSLNARYSELVRLHGADRTRLIAESHIAAVDAIEEAARTEQIQCDFERLDAFLFVSPTSNRAELEDEREAAQRAGLAVEWVSHAPIEGLETGPCLRFPRQTQLHQLKYLQGLAQGIGRLGGRIFNKTRIEHLQSGSPAIVKTVCGHEVRAHAVVVATDAPAFETYSSAVNASCRRYAISLPVPRGSVPAALYWETAGLLHYAHLLSCDSNGLDDLLIVGGDYHTTSHADDVDDCFQRLEAWARERFPQAGAIMGRWLRQETQSIDGLPLIGLDPLRRPNIYVACPGSGCDMTDGTIAAILLTDLLSGRENPWNRLYDPSRITLRTIYELASRNMNASRKPEPEGRKALLNAAALLLENSPSLSASFLGKLLGLGIRVS